MSRRNHKTLMGFAQAFADGILKYSYSADWLYDHRQVIQDFKTGEKPRGEVIARSQALRARKPFGEPETFLQAYYNAHYWSNRAKEKGDRRLYRKKDDAIIRALRHLNFEGIQPIRPRGHPGLLEIQVPSHDVLLHTYNPKIKRMLIEEGHRIPVGLSPAEPYLHERRMALVKEKMRAKAKGRLTGSSTARRIPVVTRVKPLHRAVVRRSR